MTTTHETPADDDITTSDTHSSTARESTPRQSTHRQPTRHHPTPDDVTVVEWVRDHIGPHTLKSSSDPVPVLHEHNLLAIAVSPDRVREAVLPWQRIKSHDALVGFAAFGSEPVATGATEQPDAEFDASHELRHASGRAGTGIAFGALAGAVVITLIAAIFVGVSPVLIGAAIGGAAFGGVVGGMIKFTTKTGWDAADTALAIASIHSDDLGVIELAAAAVDDVDGIRLIRVDRAGRPVT